MLAAPSNKAARLIEGKTLHNLGSFSVSDSLKTFAIKFSSHAQRKKVDAAIGRAGALLIDEWTERLHVRRGSTRTALLLPSS